MLIIGKFTYFFTPIINMQLKFNEIMISIISFHKLIFIIRKAFKETNFYSNESNFALNNYNQYSL